MENIITQEKIEKYYSITTEALGIIKENSITGKEEGAQEVIDMAENYISDSEHFKEKNDYVNAFAALNYAHGWIDAGVRLGIFNVTNRDLFTVK